MVNETMQQAYEKALVRAHKEQLVVTLLESEMAHVFNPAHDGYYTVRFPKGARQMTCNCEAGQLGNYCKHRAIVREALLIRQAEAKEEMAAQAHERWAEQENERVLTGSLWTTDQAHEYARSQTLGGYTMDELGYNADGTDRLAAAEADRETRIAQSMDHSWTTTIEGQRISDASWREAYAQIALQPYL